MPPGVEYLRLSYDDMHLLGVNMLTKPSHYPLPNMADMTSNLHRAQIFSKLYLLKGYYQLPVYPEDIPKMAITTPFVTYTFNYFCFSLRNSGTTLQCLIDSILYDLNFSICYIDDILIFSCNLQQHQPHLRTGLE